MHILIANVGTTSLKYKLFDFDAHPPKVSAAGKIERIGMNDAIVTHEAKGNKQSRVMPVPGYPDAVRLAIAALTEGPDRVLGGLGELSGIGFKVVHAKGVTGAQLLDERVLQAMEDYLPVAPAHNAAYITAIRIFRELLPQTPLAGLFETSFHATLPDYAYTYGIPRDWEERHGIRRYGFHGASHRYISERAPAFLGRSPQGMRIISCHLGGSSSICAIRDGKSIDTTMGFSPQAGLENSTRHGDLDVFAVLYAMEKDNLTIAQTREILCKQGGLKGISGMSSDVRDLEKAAASGNDRARLALDVFAWQVKKTIGAYLAILGGAEALVFTGGIGENGRNLRAKACAGMESLGIRIDPVLNESVTGEAVLSPEGSPVTVLMLPTDEEYIVARECAELLKSRK